MTPEEKLHQRMEEIQARYGITEQDRTEYQRAKEISSTDSIEAILKLPLSLKRRKLREMDQVLSIMRRHRDRLNRHIKELRDVLYDPEFQGAQDLADNQHRLISEAIQKALDE